MKRLLLVCLLVSSFMLQSQDRRLSFSGHVRPENRIWPVKVLRNAEVLVTIGERDTVGLARTDDSGFFKMDLLLPAGNSVIRVTVCARTGQRVVTIDSTCPYNVSRTPKGYFDYTEQLLLNDTQTTLVRSYRLQGGTYHPMPYTILFKKGSLDVINEEFRNTDTVLQCLRNTYNRMPDNLRIKLHVEVYSGDRAAAKLAKRRLKKIARILKNDYGIPETSIETCCDFVKAPNPDTADHLMCTLIYIN